MLRRARLVGLLKLRCDAWGFDRGPENIVHLGENDAWQTGDDLARKAYRTPW